jgi:transketolase
MLELACQIPDLVAVGTDGASAFEGIARTYPDRYIDAGIAEATAVGLAAGLARSGRRVCITAIGSFLVRRAFEQVRIDVVEPGLDVTFIAHGAGLGYGLLGSTHHLVEDVAAFQSMPTARIYAPADATEIAWALRDATATPGPTYVRIPCRIGPDLTSDRGAAVPRDQPRILRAGNDLCILGSGPVVADALTVANRLAESGVSCAVASLPALRPFDPDSVARLCRATAGVVTVAEHSRVGGLSGLVLEALSGSAVPVISLAIDEWRPVVGDYDELRQFYRIDASAIETAARSLLAERSHLPHCARPGGTK